VNPDEPGATTLSDRVTVKVNLPGIVLDDGHIAVGLTEVEASRLQTLLTERGYGGEDGDQ
jgi:hypothetical protein